RGRRGACDRKGEDEHLRDRAEACPRSVSKHGDPGGRITDPERLTMRAAGEISSLPPPHFGSSRWGRIRERACAAPLAPTRSAPEHRPPAAPPALATPRVPAAGTSPA